MSELEEPPAKVFKIDNAEAVSHATEVPDTQAHSMVEDMEILGEESGIIEGGADGPEQEEGQEEWLSEGILTDDDYNPASQEPDEHTDSQLGTDDDRPNDSTEHLDTTAESEANIAESQPDLGLESEGNTLESEPNMAESEANVAESEANMAESEANVAESEANVAESEANISESEPNMAGTEANMAESEENLAESETNMAESEANVTASEEHLLKIENLDSGANSMESQTYTQENDTYPMESEANVLESEENMRESEANMESEVNMESETNMESEINMESEANMKSVMETEADMKSVTNMESVTKIESAANMVESEANTMKNKAKDTETLPTIVNGQANMNSDVQKPEVSSVELNIEETMKHLDGNNAKNDLFDSLLIKKSDLKNESKNVKTDVKPEQDDGNDTDDLLRMLGEDDNKTKKKLTKTVKDIRAAAGLEHASSDDDDFVFEGATIKKLKAAKTALAKKQPATKAEPEDMEDGDDDTDVSADETLTMEKMFNVRAPPSSRLPNILSRQRGTSKPSSANNVVVKRAPQKNVVNVVERPLAVQGKSQSTPLKQYQNKRHPVKSILKPAPAHSAAPTPRSLAAAKSLAAPKLVEVKRETRASKRESAIKTSFKLPEIKTPAPFTPSYPMQPVARRPTRPGAEPEDMDEEFPGDDDFDFDEDEFGESDFDETSKDRQRIMRPEMMDEEIPSDGESHSEDGSLYDELPSSGSEDMDDWFQLDIRAEKAGDYIPLLGSRAKELLLEERRRVTTRLQTLKQSLSALTESGKKQAERLRDATMALAELDDMLKAS